MRQADLITEGPIGTGTRFRAQTVSMGRPVDMVIEFTGYPRPRRLAESVHRASMELHGGLTFDPVPDGTRMRWSWELQPRGMLKLMYPMVARMGRSQERRRVWTGLQRLLEARKTPSVSS